MTVLLALLGNLFFPWASPVPIPAPATSRSACSRSRVKVIVLAVRSPAQRAFLARICRLFRVPELLAAGSFLLALLAVTAANFLTARA